MIIVLPLQDLKIKCGSFDIGANFLVLKKRQPLWYHARPFEVTYLTLWLQRMMLHNHSTSKAFSELSLWNLLSFFLIALSASQIFILEGDCLENSYINNSESHPLPVLPKPWSLPGINISIWATVHLPLP